MNIAYVRVSTAEQNEQRQVNALQAYHIERWFMEKVSGKDTNRPQLKAMLDFAREGDTIYVHDFSRLARSTSDLLKIVELLQHSSAPPSGAHPHRRSYPAVAGYNRTGSPRGCSPDESGTIHSPQEKAFPAAPS